MDGINTNKPPNPSKNIYSVLNEFVKSITSKNNNNLAYFEWDKELNIISTSEAARSILSLGNITKPTNNIIDAIPSKYLNAFNQHIHDLQNNPLHIGSFAYELEINGIQVNITWLSIMDNKKILSICCHLHTNILSGDSLSALLKVIPTPALVIGPDGEYIGCNNLMLRLLDIPGNTSATNIIGSTIGTVGENSSLCKYIKTALSLAKPNLIREIQSTFTLNNGSKVYYLFSYCKHNSSTILVGLDITDVKRLEIDLLASEERNAAILKALPEVMKASALRRKDNKMDTLINQLTEDPIFTSIPGLSKPQSTPNSSTDNIELASSNDKDLYSKLIRIEVENRDMNTRLKQIETLMFLKDSGLVNRVKQSEITYETLSTRIDEVITEIDKVDKEIAIIKLTKKVIKATPGGIGTLLTTAVVSLAITIFTITYLVDKVGINKTIDRIRNPSTITIP